MHTLSFPHLPDSLDDLAAVALKLISRLTWRGEREGALGVRQVLEPALVRHREYLALRSEPSKLLLPAVHRADAAIARFLKLSKTALSPSLGSRWNPKWEPVGFVHGRLSLPGSLRGREQLLRDLRDFLQSHPEFEAPEQTVTAANAAQLLASLHAARTTLRSHSGRQRAAQSARKRACSALRKRLRTTMGRVGGLQL